MACCAERLPRAAIAGLFMHAGLLTTDFLNAAAAAGRRAAMAGLFFMLRDFTISPGEGEALLHFSAPGQKGYGAICHTCTKIRKATVCLGARLLEHVTNTCPCLLHCCLLHLVSRLEHFTNVEP